MKLQTYKLKSFDKIISILKLFSIDNPKLNFREIHDEVGLNKVTLNRLLANLVEQELLDQEPSRRVYTLGPLLLRLGFVAWSNFELRSVTSPIIKTLAERTGQTAQVFILQGMDVFVLDQAAGRSFVVKTSIGSTRPIFSTAAGKILLAYLDEDDLNSLVGKINFKPLTKKTITNPEKFISELQKIKKKGFATSFGEHNIDIYCASVPIWGLSDKVVAALSVSGPYFQFDSDSIPKIVQEIKRASQKISSEINRCGINL